MQFQISMKRMIQRWIYESSIHFTMHLRVPGHQKSQLGWKNAMTRQSLLSLFAGVVSSTDSLLSEILWIGEMGAREFGVWRLGLANKKIIVVGGRVFFGRCAARSCLAMVRGGSTPIQTRSKTRDQQHPTNHLPAHNIAVVP